MGNRRLPGAAAAGVLAGRTETENRLLRDGNLHLRAHSVVLPITLTRSSVIRKYFVNNPPSLPHSPPPQSVSSITGRTTHPLPRVRMPDCELDEKVSRLAFTTAIVRRVNVDVSNAYNPAALNQTKHGDRSGRDSKRTSSRKHVLPHAIITE
jgi:hypothetical protein